MIPDPLSSEPTQVGPMRSSAPTAGQIARTHVYSFVLDADGQPVEIGSGRFAKAFLGIERWLESKTDFQRPVAIKVLQKGVSGDDALRFQMEKDILERVQGHPNIIGLYASGESDNPDFIPLAIRDRVENDFVIIELCDLSLEERLKGSRDPSQRENLLDYRMPERLFRVLEYLIPIAGAVEHAHLVRHVVHRDIKPANVLLRLPDPRVQGSVLEVKLADFNVGKAHDDDGDLSLTRLHSVPGTLFFQSPEQEINILELLVDVQRGAHEVHYFEDFYLNAASNDAFQLFNRPERYAVAGVDRSHKKILLERPFAEPTERNVRAKLLKSVDRPADIYSLGAMFYYLVSGAVANPKTLYDAFHKFIEFEREDEDNTVEAYLGHEYRVINSLRAPKKEGERVEPAPAERFFSYKHYLDGRGELIDAGIMSIVARAMIRNKRDSYCQAWDITTTGISDLVVDLINLYCDYGVDRAARPSFLGRLGRANVVVPRRHAWARLFGRR